jgi:hypothetical protein
MPALQALHNAANYSALHDPARLQSVLVARQAKALEAIFGRLQGLM